MNAISNVKTPTAGSETATATIEARAVVHKAACEALRSGDAGPWVKLHRDTYGWRLFLESGAAGQLKLGCDNGDQFTLIQDMESEHISSIIGYLREERDAAFRAAEAAVNALPFLKTEVLGKKNPRTRVASYWSPKSAKRGVHAQRAGIDAAKDLFSLPLHGLSDCLIENILRAMVSPSSPNRLEGTVEGGFLGIVAEVLFDCHRRAPHIIARALQLSKFVSDAIIQEQPRTKRPVRKKAVSGRKRAQVKPAPFKKAA